MEPTTEFSKKVINLIKKIPRGQVATYGQIAGLAGKPQGSRGVAWILHSCSESHNLPWQRVVNAQGKISFPPSSALFVRQKNLLRKEGVLFDENSKIDLKKYQWKKKPLKKKLQVKSPQMFS